MGTIPSESCTSRTVNFTGDGACFSPEYVAAWNQKSTNKINTTNYNWATAVPVALLVQFRNIEYFFYIFVLVLTCLPKAPVPPWGYLSCFLLVLTVGVAKELWEDRSRGKDDRVVNESKCWVYNLELKDFEEVFWESIVFGDLLYIQAGDFVPADLVMLYLRDDLDAFASSANLDGETSWKPRAVPVGLSRMLADLSGVRNCLAPGIQEAAAVSLQFTSGSHSAPNGVTVCAPTRPLWEISGCVNLSWGSGETVYNMTADNFLPRGTILQGSAKCWTLGIAAYVGVETKVMQQTEKPRIKDTSLAGVLRVCLVGCIFLLLLLCLYLALMRMIYVSFSLWRAAWFLVILAPMVPMPLEIFAKVLNIILTRFLYHDTEMVDERNGKHATPRSPALIVELGQVSHVFSDKTGTLTQNKMTLANLCLPDGFDFGDFRPASADTSVSPGFTIARRLLWEIGEKREDAYELFLCNSLCHTLNVEVNDSGPDVEYEFFGASPEEITLVAASHRSYITLASKRYSHNGQFEIELLVGISRERKRYRLVHTVPFSSDRKRMSVVLQNLDNLEDIFVVTKGADSIMCGLVAGPFSEKIQSRLHQYASDGLRTLVVASRHLDLRFLEECESELSAARNLPDDDRTDMVDALVAKIECDLSLVGIIAIEDALQENVKETVEAIRKAGTVFWMLTGDKTETAISIAFESGVVSMPSAIWHCTCEHLTLEVPGKSETNQSTVANFLQTVDNSLDENGNSTLVLDGTCFGFVHESEECQKLLYKVASRCTSCVCARLSPQQKKILVNLIRRGNPDAITLAIGDGANDVPMIIAAHVGVGIEGIEGAQALQASDFSITKFKYLLPLMHYHGREAYRRTSFFLLTFLYKQWAIYWPLVVCYHFVKFKPVPTLPLLVFTIMPPISTIPSYVLAVWDQEASYEDGLRNTWLYKSGPARKHFNPWVFSWWAFLGLIHGAALWLVPQLSLCHDNCEFGSENFWIIRFASYNATHVLIYWQIAVSSHRKFWLMALCAVVVTWLIFMVAMYIPIWAENKKETDEQNVKFSGMFVAAYSIGAFIRWRPLLVTVGTILIGPFLHFLFKVCALLRRRGELVESSCVELTDVWKGTREGLIMK